MLKPSSVRLLDSARLLNSLLLRRGSSCAASQTALCVCLCAQPTVTQPAPACLQDVQLSGRLVADAVLAGAFAFRRCASSSSQTVRPVSDAHSLPCTAWC